MQLQQHLRPRPFAGCGCNAEVVRRVWDQAVEDEPGPWRVRYIGAPGAKQSERVLCYLPVGLQRALPHYLNGG